MPLEKTQSHSSSQIRILGEISTPVCQQWAHLVEREGISLESTARAHKLDLSVILQLNPSLGPKNRVLSPFHDLILLPKQFSKVDGADVCVRDGESNLLGYDNRKYIPSFVKEVLEEWGQSFLSKFDEARRDSFELELAPHGPNYLLFNIDEAHSKIENVQRRNTSFRFTIKIGDADLPDVESKLRESFASLPSEKKGLIIISGIKKNPKQNSYVVTFTLSKNF